MGTSVRLIVRDASPYSAATEHLADAETLAAELRGVGFDPVKVELAPPPAGAPMASGVAEWLMAYLGGPVFTLVLADLYKRCELWARARITQLPDATLIEQEDGDDDGQDDSA